MANAEDILLDDRDFGGEFDRIIGMSVGDVRYGRVAEYYYLDAYFDVADDVFRDDVIIGDGDILSAGEYGGACGEYRIYDVCDFVFGGIFDGRCVVYGCGNGV